MIKKRLNRGKLVARVFLLVIILAVMCLGYVLFNKINIVYNIFKEVEKEEATLSEYIVYGTHLNLKGNLNLDNENMKCVNLILKTSNGEEKKTNLNYEKTSNGIDFYTSELINEGINLETINVGLYYMFIEVEYKNGKSKYYSISNDTEYGNVEYYTITENNTNKKININFSNYSISGEDINYMYIEAKRTYLPSEVYDVVIDPGHRR